MRNRTIDSIGGYNFFQVTEIAPPEYVIFNHLTHLHSERGVHINHSLFPIILPFWNFNLKNMKPRIHYITHWRRNKNQSTRGTIHFIMTIIFYEYCSSTFWANSYLFNIIILFCAHVYIICTRIIILPKRKESIFIFSSLIQTGYLLSMILLRR